MSTFDLALTALVPRADAVAEIAAHLADRTAFVVAVPVKLSGPIAVGLKRVPDWTCYIDGGEEFVVRTQEPWVPEDASHKTLAAFVVVVPKTVPAATLSTAFDRPIPADGSEDVVILTPPDESGVTYPALFVDALELADPEVAAYIRATDVRGLS